MKDFLTEDAFNSNLSADTKSFPSFVQIQVSNKCNAACSFCPYPYTEAKETYKLMNFDLYKKIILECKPNKVGQILPFFLNEPLLNKDLFKYIKFAKENSKAIVKIFTNGSLLDEKTADKLIESKIDQVIFSFNGSNKEDYERLMKPLKFEQTRDRIVSFINKCKERKNSSKPAPDLAVHVLKTGIDPKPIVDYFNKLHIAVHVLKYENRAGNVRDYDINPPLSEIKKVPCSRLLNQLYVLVDGRVILCCADWNKEVILGDLNKQTISEVWNSPTRLEYVDAHMTGNFSMHLCDKCNFNEIKSD